MRPPSATTRSRMPSRPDPPGVAGLAPPTPSSLTRTLISSPATVTSTRTTDAAACRAALVTASETKKYAVDSTVSGKRWDGALISTGSGARSASAFSADARPSCVSSMGWIPRASSRSSVIACCRSSAAWSRNARSRGSAPSPARARACPRVIDSASSRCCAPSCRSRSIRCRASCPASTSRAVVERSCTSWLRTSACSRSFYSANRAIAPAACSSAGSCSTISSTSITASGPPSPLIGATVRPGEATGSRG